MGYALLLNLAMENFCSSIPTVILSRVENCYHFSFLIWLSSTLQEA